MPTACINQSECRISLESERLIVRGRDADDRPDQVLREIPIRDLDRLIVAESVQVSSGALTALFRAAIPVSYLAWNGQFIGGFLPATNTHGQARLRQYQRSLDARFALELSGRIVVAKVYNQRRVIQRLLASRRQAAGEPEDNAFAAFAAPVESTLGWMDALFASIRVSQTLDELRGFEGAATARYFQAWGRFLPEAFPFERRSKRPPHNPVNACISFGATLLYNEAVAFLHAHGLDPALGLLHATEDGRWSLALDLIEPFRPVLVEALALDLFSHQIVDQSGFVKREGGVFLNEEGRKKFFLQYERRMERQFLSEAEGHRTTLRQQVENQALMYKAALEDAVRFEPFLMN